MILGVGIDLVNSKRMIRWTNLPQQQLLKIFSTDELSYCRQNNFFDLKRLASRFAAKEAFYKSLSASLVKLEKTEITFSLLFACKHVQVKMTTFDTPILSVDWLAFEEKIGKKLPSINVDVSLTHDGDFSAAVVILSK
jgi:phosphopantetheine--protein transferase-like protein